MTDKSISFCFNSGSLLYAFIFLSVFVVGEFNIVILARIRKYYFTYFSSVGVGLALGLLFKC